MPHRVVTCGAALVDDYLLVWVLLSVGVGIAVPSVATLAPLTTPILAVMIGAVSLTLAPNGSAGSVDGRWSRFSSPRPGWRFSGSPSPVVSGSRPRSRRGSWFSVR